MDKVNQKPAKRYAQFCALARALDIVGERWTLLIVRELLPGAMRYTELKTSLSGIATNLLADRLRTMEANGLIERRLTDTSVAYALTPRGRDLQEPMEALGRWGVPLLETGRGDDAFAPRWLTLALPALLRGATSMPPVELSIETDGLRMVLRIDAAGPSVVIPPDDDLPQTQLRADPDVIVALAAGAISVDDAIAAGELVGDPAVLRTAFAAR